MDTAPNKACIYQCHFWKNRPVFKAKKRRVKNTSQKYAAGHLQGPVLARKSQHKVEGLSQNDKPYWLAFGRATERI